MFKTIVVALDGSDVSTRTIPIVTELAKGDNARVVIVHVDEWLAAKGGAEVNADEDDVKTAVRQHARELSDQGIETTVEIRDVMAGGPARPIAEVAAEQEADLIVVGTHGHSAVAGVLVGSVTQRLLHLAHRPVLAIPPPQ
jgi:nucleotide-binding universal stress UspA family protein